MTTDIQSLLDFWFGDILTGAPLTAEKSRLWFGKSESVDREMAARFSGLVERAGKGLLDSWAKTSEGLLALLVLLDQFPRNIYRGQPRAFAFDPLALKLALRVVDSGLDHQLPVLARAFVYLPLEHSESLAMQDRAVELFTRLLQEAPDQHRTACASYLDYAERHRDVIVRFGRYPHRNAILGRVSTAAEAAFLLQPGSSF
jgi:uncharacterized protein (DUF924 family)